MHIVYVAATCSDAVYAQLFAGGKGNPSFQAQKYHRLFAAGLAQNCRVDVIGYPPIDNTSMEQERIDLPEETADGAHYHYIRVYRNSIRKLLHLGPSVFCEVFRRLDKDGAVMIDCLNQVSGLAALLAARLRGCRCVGIITDLPEFQGGGPTVALASFLIRHCTDYVVLTEAMNDRVNPNGKPYAVLEGHADISMEKNKPSLEIKRKPRICLYAGSIHEMYGIKRLVEGFQLAKVENTQLHIYGAGDYQQELQRIAAEDPSIVYGGLLMPSQVVAKEMEATLLVNPRPTDEEYVKYSFPSKTMEYMSTGTPVLTTMLPGLPKEYDSHVFFIREENAEGIAAALREVLNQSDAALFAKGCQAREFVLKERNNVVQAEKVLDMLKGSNKE